MGPSGEGEQDVELETTEARSGELEPAEARSGELEPAEARSGELELAETRSGELEPAEARSGELEPAEARSGELEPAEARSGELELAETRPGELELAETRSGEPEPAEARSGEQRPNQQAVDDEMPIADTYLVPELLPEGAIQRGSSTTVKPYFYIESPALKDFVNKEVNYYGVLVEWEKARKTKGPDLICSYKVLDVAHYELVEIRIFAPAIHLMPRPKKVGDILRVHRARVTQYTRFLDDKLDVTYQLTARIGLPNQLKYYTSSFCIFDGRHDDTVLKNQLYRPYHKSSPHYHLDSNDINLIHSLRIEKENGEWDQHYRSYMEEKGMPYRRQIKSVFTRPDEKNYWDLVAMVVHIEPDVINGMSVIWIWDGTNAPPYPPEFDSRGSEQGFDSSSLNEIELMNSMNSMRRLVLELSVRVQFNIIITL